LRRHRGTARRISEHVAPELPQAKLEHLARQRQAKGFQKLTYGGASRGIIALRAWSSIEASSHHAACRQAFGLSGRQGGLIAPQPIQLHASALCPSPAFPAGREAPLGAAMGARNKVGRLSYGRTDREWSCATADPDRPRLDGQISKRRRGTGEPERQDRLHRRRALRRRRRGTAKLRTDASGHRTASAGCISSITLSISCTLADGTSRACR
jgi:hypothetical protein